MKILLIRHEIYLSSNYFVIDLSIMFANKDRVGKRDSSVMIFLMTSINVTVVNVGDIEYQECVTRGSDEHVVLNKTDDTSVTE